MGLFEFFLTRSFLIIQKFDYAFGNYVNRRFGQPIQTKLNFSYTKKHSELFNDDLNGGL